MLHSFAGLLFYNYNSKWISSYSEEDMHMVRAHI